MYKLGQLVVIVLVVSVPVAVRDVALPAPVFIDPEFAVP